MHACMHDACIHTYIHTYIYIYTHMGIFKTWQPAKKSPLFTVILLAVFEGVHMHIEGQFGWLFSRFFCSL